MAVRPLPSTVVDRIRGLLGEHPRDPDDWLERLGSLAGAGEGIFAEAVRMLFHVSMEDGEARALLGTVLRRRQEWARRIGRDPGMVVAALDYALRETSLLERPVVLEARALDDAITASTRDPVTGLLRPQTFLDALRRECGRSRRHARGFAVVLFQVDGFRSGTDRFGHRFGEALLREVAECIRGCVRSCDRAGHLEPGRFGVLLPGADRTGAFRLADRVRVDVREALADRVTESCPEGHTVSAGIAVQPEDGDRAAVLLDAAGRGLGRARANGGDSVTLYHGERRAGVRFPVRPSSRLALTSDGGVAASAARGVDLSQGGALVEIDPRFDAGGRVHVYLKRSDAAGWSSFADVVRQVRTGTGERLVGLRFERPMPQAKVREFAFAGSRDATSGREAMP